MAKVAGTAKFTIDGEAKLLRGNMTVMLGSFERESVVGMDGYHGFKETPSAPSIECDLTDTPDIDLNVLESLTDKTIRVELSNGKVGVLRNASQMNKLSLNAADGQFTVRFEGAEGEWETVAQSA